jgi:hypothetical protein
MTYNQISDALIFLEKNWCVACENKEYGLADALWEKIVKLSNIMYEIEENIK